MSPTETTDRYDAIIAEMSLREKLCHVMCPRMSQVDEDSIAEYLEKFPVGCAYIGGGPAEEVGERMRALQEASVRPVLTCMDLVWGPGHALKGTTQFPAPMAVGAADSEELTYTMGRATALQGRLHGIHMTLAPLADINMNHRSPIVNIRAFGDERSHVLRHASAFIRGVQETGVMAATAKHFPGDGVDEKDQHYVTSVTDLSRQEWEEQFGYVYSALIEQGVQAIMIGHIGLPWCDPEGAGTYIGPRPASLSRRIVTGLLREQLGFEGTIMTDAMDMIGCVSHVPVEQLAVQQLAAGNDILLFAEPERDYESLMRACESGAVTQERLHDAVRRILKLKDELGILDEVEDYSLPAQEKKSHDEAAVRLAEESICVVRDVDGILPLDLEEGARVLSIAIRYETHEGTEYPADIIAAELEERGLDVDRILNPGHKKLRAIAADYDAIFVNVNINPKGVQGTILIKDVALWTFWDLAVVKHPRVVVTSLGDPYKLGERPYLKTYVNAFSPTPESVQAAVKVWLGELEPRGKSPVALQGVFDREV